MHWPASVCCRMLRLGGGRTLTGYGCAGLVFIRQPRDMLTPTPTPALAIHHQAKKKAAAGKPAGKVVVPYREATLTWLLKGALGGNSQVGLPFVTLYRTGVLLGAKSRFGMLSFNGAFAVGATVRDG